MSKSEERVTRAALAYQWAIRGEHHKDRDCHFAIRKHWSYGEAPTYHVEHEGYLHDWDGPTSFPSVEAAERALAVFIDKCTADVVNWE